MGDSSKSGNTGSKTVVVSSSSHHEKLISGLWNYFLTNHAVDFEIQWNGRSVRTHRVLLDLFLSTDKLVETAAAQQSIQQQQTKSNNLDSLMEFMYKGTVTISEEQLVNVQDIAKQSEFKILVDALEIAVKRVNAKNAKVNIRTVKRNKRKIKCIQKLVTYSDDEVEFDQAKFEAAPATTKRQLRSSTMAKPATSKTVNNSETDGDASFPVDFEPPGSDDADFDEPYRVPKKTKIDASSFKMFNCEKCIYTTHREELLQAHMKDTCNERTSKSTKTFRCKTCPFKTINLHGLKVHNAIHDPSITVYKCKWCPMKFLDPEVLAKHKCTRLGGANVPKCPHCDFRTKNRRHFLLHVANHDPNAKIYRCKCGLKYPDEESLKQHRCKWLNPNAKHFQCPHCPYTNKFKHQLGYHIKGMHSGTKPFKCEEPGCDYACRVKVMMTNHVKFVHQGHRPFVCDKCAYSTNKQSRLNLHLRVHSDERPYKCNECDKTYRDSKSLKKHVIGSHGDDVKNYVCDLCGTSFRCRDTLMTHIRRVHKSQVPAFPSGSAAANARRTLPPLQSEQDVSVAPQSSQSVVPHPLNQSMVRQFQQPMPMPPPGVDLGFSRPKVPNQLEVPYPTTARNYFWNLN